MEIVVNRRYGGFGLSVAAINRRPLRARIPAAPRPTRPETLLRIDVGLSFEGKWYPDTHRKETLGFFGVKLLFLCFQKYKRKSRR